MAKNEKNFKTFNIYIMNMHHYNL